MKHSICGVHELNLDGNYNFKGTLVECNQSRTERKPIPADRAARLGLDPTALYCSRCREILATIDRPKFNGEIVNRKSYVINQDKLKMVSV